MTDVRTEPPGWRRSVKRDLAAIVLVALATHGLLLLMDGVYFDDYLLRDHLTAKDWPLMNAWISQAGQQLAIPFFRAVGALPDIVFGCRLAAFLAITLTSVLLYLICVESKMLSRWESLLLALVQLTFPAFRTTFLLVVLIYLVCYLFFTAGIYFAVKSYLGRGWRRVVLRLLSLALLFASFSTNSLIVFYVGFIVFMIFVVRRWKAVSIWTAARHYLPRHIDFVLLPFAYWAIKEFLTPRWGVYEGYNKIQLSPTSLVVEFIRGVANAVVFQLNEAFVQLLAYPLLGLVLIAVLVFLFARPGSRARVTFESPPSARCLVAAGASLVLLAILPYALVAKAPTVLGWDTRHALLVSLGVGVVIVGALKVFCVPPGYQLPRAGIAVAASIVLACAATMVDSYVSWQMRWIKDHSVEANLKAMPPCPASTYWIDDRFPMAREVAAEPYKDYEWATIFKNAWGGETRTGLYPGTDLADYNATKGEHYRTGGWGRICNLSGYDASGPQASIVIRPGRFAGGIQTMLWYWWYRYVNRGKFEEYLRDVTEVSLTIVAEAEATPNPGGAPPSP